MEHCRGVNFCRKGIKAFCERHGIDWKLFLKQGIPKEQLLAIDDAMATKAVEFMRKQNGYR